MRVKFILALAASLLFWSCPPTHADSDLDLVAASQLRLLELKFFEHTFDSEPAADRVDRIERLVKGETTDGDLSVRVKTIASTLIADGESLSPSDSDGASFGKGSKSAAREEKKPLKSQAPSRDRAASTDKSADPDSSEPDRAEAGETGDYPKITNLEKELLKQTYAGEPLADRLSRLETRAFGSPTKSNDLGARTDRLEAYAQRTLHRKPFAVNPDIDGTYMVRESAPNSAAGAPQAVEHFFNLTHRFADEFSNRATMPQATARQELQQPDEDPGAYTGEPPPAGTRMITRVAWCEVQAFGHTFPTMHLTRRLRQLGNALVPKTEKDSDLQLMDDLDQIQSAIMARKQTKPTGTPTT